MTEPEAHAGPGDGQSVATTDLTAIPAPRTPPTPTAPRGSGEPLGTPTPDGLPETGHPGPSDPLDQGEPDADASGPVAPGPREPAADAGDTDDVDTVEGETEGKDRSFWRELPALILIALVIAVLIKTFAFQAFYIPSSSMEDTLEINDRVLVNKIEYRIGDIDRGDVLVFDDPTGDTTQESVVQAVFRNLAESVGLSTPKSEFIKRVVGLPGDEILITDGTVHVNGEPLDEPYLHPNTNMPDFGPIVVESGRLFMMGDNRNASQDSRFFGTVDIDTVVGRAFVILWPPSRWAGL